MRELKTLLPQLKTHIYYRSVKKFPQNGIPSSVFSNVPMFLQKTCFFSLCLDEVDRYRHGCEKRSDHYTNIRRIISYRILLILPGLQFPAPVQAPSTRFYSLVDWSVPYRAELSPMSTHIWANSGEGSAQCAFQAD